MSENFDRYTDLFLEEASEQIEELNQNLLILEKEGYDPEVINEIFRTAHTLKSSAAFVGLEDLSDLAHKMEDLLQQVKDEKVEVTTELVNVFFLCLDRIKIAVAQVSEGRIPEDTYADLIESLKNYIKDHQSGTPSPAQKPKTKPVAQVKENLPAEPEPVSEEPDNSSVGPKLSANEEVELSKAAKGKNVYDGYVSIDEDAPMKNMRFLLLIQNLKRAGAVFKSVPAESSLEEGDDPHMEFRFVYYGDKSREEISAFCAVDMVEEVHVIEHSFPAGLAPEPSAAVASKKNSPAGKKANEEKAGETHVKTKNIKVSSEKIDYLLNSVGELVITNSGLLKIYEDLHEELGETGYLSELKSKIDQAARIARDLQSGIMKTRMIPVELVFQRFTRPVRDLSLELGKEVDVIFKGEDTELDKNIIDALNDPLLHLIRNSLDHGIELPADREKAGKPRRGTLLLNAYQSGNSIYLEIKDDGKGLNRERIFKKAVERGLVNEDAMLSDDDIYNFVFHPGFSTAEKVSDVSGRGVGMNVVKKMVQEFKGTIFIQTESGKGTSFILSFPLTLAIISAILVKIESEVYAFPLSDVVETIKVNREDITTLQGKDIINLRGDILPIFQLSLLMGLDSQGYKTKQEFPVVIANINNRKIGFVVDAMVGKQEIVIKSLEQNFRSVRGLIGATLMGDGSIVMVLDVQGLLDLAQSEETYNKNTEKLRPTSSYNEAALKLTGSARRLQRGSRRIKDKEDEEIPAKTASVQAPAAAAPEPAVVPQVAAMASQNAAGHHASAAVAEPLVPVTPPAPAPVSVPVKEELDKSVGGHVFKTTKEFDSVDAPAEKVSEALQSLESEKQERKQRAQNILSKGASETTTPAQDRDLTEDEYSRLYSVINTGMINAGFVLSQLLGISVEVSVPEFKTIDYRDLKDYMPSEKVISVLLDTIGDFRSVIMLVFDHQNGFKAAAELMGHPAGADVSDDDAKSVLSELTNIVGSSILNALANKTGLTITPSVPYYMNEQFEKVIAEVDKKGIMKQDARVIYISADFFRDDMELLGRVFLLPSRPTLSQMVGKL